MARPASMGKKACQKVAGAGAGLTVVVHTPPSVEDLQVTTFNSDVIRLYRKF